MTKITLQKFTEANLILTNLNLLHINMCSKSFTKKSKREHFFFIDRCLEMYLRFNELYSYFDKKGKQCKQH